MAMTEVLSQYIDVGCNMGMSNLEARCMIQRRSVVAYARAQYSISVEDLATVCCF